MAVNKIPLLSKIRVQFLIGIYIIFVHITWCLAKIFSKKFLFTYFFRRYYAAHVVNHSTKTRRAETNMTVARQSILYTVKPLNSGHLPIADTLSQSSRCPLFGGFTVLIGD